MRQPLKRLRTNRKLIAAELKKLSALAKERRFSMSFTAMCLGAAYALGWVIGEYGSPSRKDCLTRREEEAMKKRRCQGVLIENDMAQGDEDALVCCWCGTTQRPLFDVGTGDRCLATFAPLTQVKTLGHEMNQVRVTDACVGGARRSATKGAAVGRRPRKNLSAGAGRL